MESSILFLFSRKGCCLCEGLEEKLHDLNLEELTPPLRLVIVDIDSIQTPETLRRRYDLLVPVMALGEHLDLDLRVLPRVSPRLNGERLFYWLQKTCTDLFNSGKTS